eukprot:COSAG01_NODE_57939_length_309_cov_0.738095_2_plen_33_part_01
MMHRQHAAGRGARLQLEARGQLEGRQGADCLPG